MKHVNGVSITLIRHLIESILVSVDIAIREGALFCNVTCDQGPFKNKQVSDDLKNSLVTSLKFWSI